MNDTPHSSLIEVLAHPLPITIEIRAMMRCVSGGSSSPMIDPRQIFFNAHAKDVVEE